MLDGKRVFRVDRPLKENPDKEVSCGEFARMHIAVQLHSYLTLCPIIADPAV